MPKELGLIPDPLRVNELSRYYEIMGNKIRDELLRIDAGSFTEPLAISVQKNVRGLVDQMNRRAIQWSSKATPEAYGDAAKISKATLDILGAVKDPRYDPITHTKSIEDNEETTEKTLIRANLSINTNVATYIYLTRQAHEDIMQIQAFDMGDEEIFTKLLRKTAAEGGSRGDLQRLIRIHFNRELYEKKFISIGGKNYDMTKYAKMVARTTLRDVQSEAVENMCNQFDNDLVEISDHGTVSEICIPYEGNTYSINGKTPGYRTIPAWPPYHPNCEHFASPTSVEAQSLRPITGN